MGADGAVYVTPEHAGVETRARLRVLDSAAAGVRVSRTELALALLTAAVADLGLFPVEALEAAAEAAGEHGERRLQTVAAGVRLAGV